MEPRHDGQQQPQVGGQTGERGEPLLPPPAEAEGQPEAGDAEAEPATPPLPPGIDEEDLQCIICFEDYDRASRLPILLPCDHRCCKECFDKLTLERRSRWRYAENRGVTVPCPLCRREASQREVRMDLLLLSVIVAPNSPQAVDFRRSRTNSADGLIEGRASAQGTGTTLSENVMLCAGQ
uniref:RING-type domain-containing protein n=1 Tax=Chromera velia CCMP2878 TaxID=1169474 RepID=A0A0G4FLB8_9ALVE|eukprot:Cvel_17579.t1-p1 / transcript=Cvel_17579.t1 / gene=Cvel_17579 / organism=Chromera_velia_CCMP2878 / gene_product=hypothetical protein / transcript_product=hypothetical protein / location=Cvel_scaffold1412:45993-46529(+) / protein_length=179 / sequence_SO=supercontig / SO=protein_coding / is_pseudo=false